MDLKRQLRIPFPNAIEAEIAYRVLKVDKEPPRSNVIKEMKLEGNEITVEFTGDQPKKLRVAAKSFEENVSLVKATIEKFK
ncbi:EKC/KEOPS complex subunit Lage3 [Prorops nasuta]|uniref:EKC/KEOPS complex subunit Lage3 n=1 Tax=Prorops nasuta TaxID=863751 RepID=UPI0034CF4C2E